ncbi:MAG: hypothetical protein AABZ60_15605 [Planctomycetota bacterium]|mgnify:CR=1 FL=1
MPFFWPLRSRHTFTLLEVMIAGTLLIMAIMGIAMTFLTVANLNTLSKENNFAACQARKIMEEIRSTPFKDILSKYQDKNYSIPGLNLQKGDLDENVGKIQTTKVNDKKDLLDVTVRLDWRGKVGNRSLSIKTRIAEIKKKKRKKADDLLGEIFK